MLSHLYRNAAHRTYLLAYKELPILLQCCVKMCYICNPSWRNVVFFIQEKFFVYGADRNWQLEQAACKHAGSWEDLLLKILSNNKWRRKLRPCCLIRILSSMCLVNPTYCRVSNWGITMQCWLLQGYGVKARLSNYGMDTFAIDLSHSRQPDNS